MAVSDTHLTSVVEPPLLTGGHVSWTGRFSELLSCSCSHKTWNCVVLAYVYTHGALKSNWRSSVITITSSNTGKFLNFCNNWFNREFKRTVKTRRKAVELCIPPPDGELTFHFLSPKPKQFMSVPRRTNGKSCVKIQQLTAEISRKQHERRNTDTDERTNRRAK